MTKKRATLIGLVAALGIALIPLAAHAGGLPDVAVRIVNPADGSEVMSTTTNSYGRFMFENVAAGAYRLEATREDQTVTPPAITHFAAILFTVADAKAPARVMGKVCANPRLDISLEVGARVASMVFDIVPGYPKMPLRWNLNGRHSRGLILVKIKGTGLDQVTEVALVSGTASVPAMRMFKSPMGTRLLAVFGKRAVFEALVPADAKRGDKLPVSINVTTAMGTQSFDKEVTLVGRGRRWRR